MAHSTQSFEKTIKSFIRNENATAALEFAILVWPTILVIVACLEIGMVYVALAQLDDGAWRAAHQLEMDSGESTTPVSHDLTLQAVCRRFTVTGCSTDNYNTGEHAEKLQVSVQHAHDEQVGVSLPVRNNFTFSNNYSVSSNFLIVVGYEYKGLTNTKISELVASAFTPSGSNQLVSARMITLTRSLVRD